MTTEIAIILLLDGIANGAIYLLAGLGLVLIFSVTRVVFVPFGDITAFCVLSIAAFELGPATGHDLGGRDPGRYRNIIDVAGHIRSGERCGSAFAAVLWPAAADPLRARLVRRGACFAPCGADRAGDMLVLPIAPLLDRIAFRPAADAPVLVLLIIALALHFALSGLGLMFFGAEGFAFARWSTASTSRRRRHRLAQVLLMVITAALLSLLFFLFFERSMSGRALRATAVNRIGARLVGIRPARTGTIAYFIASLLAGVSAILVGPTTTIYYDSWSSRSG
jgi:branched-chain amino acid transport system permease protein